MRHTSQYDSCTMITFLSSLFVAACTWSVFLLMVDPFASTYVVRHYCTRCWWQNDSTQYTHKPHIFGNESVVNSEMSYSRFNFKMSFYACLVHSRGGTLLCGLSLCFNCCSFQYVPYQLPPQQAKVMFCCHCDVYDCKLNDKWWGLRVW